MSEDDHRNEVCLSERDFLPEGGPCVKERFVILKSPDRGVEHLLDLAKECMKSQGEKR